MSPPPEKKAGTNPRKEVRKETAEKGKKATPFRGGGFFSEAG